MTRLVLLATLGAALCLHAQQPTSGKRYRIAGTVTNSATGEPLAGTTLLLASAATRHSLQTTVTDSQGHFDLEPVPAGKYTLTGSRRGFRTANFDEHETYSSAIVTGEGQDTGHIPFKLDANAIVRGFVTDDLGEPIAGAKVTLARQSKDDGLGDRLVEEISGMTDDEGLFEYWGMEPGTYFLAAQADPWFALHGSLADRDRAEADLRADRAALDLAYPLCFYAGTSEEAAATPIKIAGGNRIQADLRMHTVPALHLRIRSPHKKAGKDDEFLMPTLRQTILGQAVPLNAEQEIGSPDITEYAGIAPGHYTIVGADPPRLLDVDLNGDQDIDLSTGTPAFDVGLKLHMIDGSPVPETVQLSLVSNDATRQKLTEGEPAESGDLRFEAVPPGRWTVMAESPRAPVAVVSILLAGASASGPVITVKDRAVTATAIIAQPKSHIEGFVTKDGKGEPGVMVVLVPADPVSGVALFRRDQSDSDGSFDLLNVIPGTYRIVAIENGWDLDWARPEVIAHYLPNATPVTVTSKSPEAIQLSAKVAVQPR
jgi:5-hydroxyisourate hydrolase-like protein (transthyretin family)